MPNQKWDLNVVDIKANFGAKFVTVYLGEIQTLPGLPTRPSYIDMEYVNGETKGLF